ncbi:PREDICTED: interferon alpha/beta receptor 1 isoform X2 [Chinchilla lanigera]|uniref:interferon alpha/beta receptor 1 isoform X2 n=1 Tax=Chinchilla lanigera TaxID=34839 RepID=UPI00038EEDE9|nr:PREDICTED: interferon alpha/beta receptor 1 isoform X2 [Chinchilla lanigera]
MLAVLGAAALVLVAGVSWASRAAADGTSLKPPQDVEVSIIDDDFTLKWNRSHESVGNVTFSADYITSEMNNWTKLPGCQHITGSECSFFLPKLNFYEEVEFRIRAEEENSTSSWYYIDSFIPFRKALLGPPEVRLEAEDTAIIVHLFRPGKKDDHSIWEMVGGSFRFTLDFWENSSHAQMEQKQIEIKHYTHKIYNLSSETTYCLKVKARLLWDRKVGVYSPVYCINTTVEHKLPPPENVKFAAQNQSYVLKWDYEDGNVTFRVQWLHAYSKLSPGDKADEWRQIINCENVRTTYCVLPQDAFQKKSYFFRVQASDGNNTSFWSEEKEVNIEMYSAMPPPVISLKSTSDSLRVFVKAPRNQLYPLLFEIIMWENTSSTERIIIAKKSDITIPDLQPLTLYCVKASVYLLEDKWNKSSAFSATVCEKTKPGPSPPVWAVTLGICTLLAVVVVVVFCVAKILLRCLNYVFFPALKPPCSIESLGNLLLSTSEEQTEKCFIIENTERVILVEEPEETEEDCKKYNSQTSQDSGNYSHGDESLESLEISEVLLQLKVLSPGRTSQELSGPGEIALGRGSQGPHRGYARVEEG